VLAVYGGEIGCNGVKYRINTIVGPGALEEVATGGSFAAKQQNDMIYIYVMFVLQCVLLQ